MGRIDDLMRQAAELSRRVEALERELYYPVRGTGRPPFDPTANLGYEGPYGYGSQTR